MDQTDKSTDEQKPKICELAILSPLIIICGFLLWVVFAGFSIHIPKLYDFLAIVFIVSPFIGLVLGIVAGRKIHKSKGTLKGRMFSTSGTVLSLIGAFFALIIFFLPPMGRVPWAERRVICGAKLTRLGKAMQAYSNCYDQKYPIKDKWCDLLIENADVNEKDFVCKGALKSSDKGPCHYALNPNCAPNSHNDVVLLFETKGGWNQYGGQEMLTTEHHEGKGCNILFNNGDVKFIETNQLSGLKWGNKPKDEPNQ
jgi:hypothetical protein